MISTLLKRVGEYLFSSTKSTEEPETRFCKDCHWCDFSKLRSGFDTSRCCHPHARNTVTGDPGLCKAERIFGCGENARRFKEK